MIRKPIAIIVAAFIFCVFPVAVFAADAPPIRVTVWDERQPKQKQAYDNFLGNAIASYLEKQPGLSVKSVGMDDPEWGLPEDLLNNTDVLIWWGHIRNRQVPTELGKKIALRIKEGKLNLIALHSAHWSAPFVQAMYLRTVDDAMKSLSEEERAKAKVNLINPRPYSPPKKDAEITPSVKKTVAADGSITLDIKLPICCFPAWREDGKPSHVTTLAKDHPIAKGIPEKFDLPHTEMYTEAFHVPAPDAVIFEEKWDAGEHFRSGMVWELGKGKVFYFRPGHESYDVYKQELPLKILENAVRWMGGRE